jgi:mono/diheme cytochrome c family protein
LRQTQGRGSLPGHEPEFESKLTLCNTLLGKEMSSLPPVAQPPVYRRSWFFWLLALGMIAVVGLILGKEWLVVLGVLSLASWGAATWLGRRFGWGPVRAAIFAAGGVLVLAQLVPFGRSHSNPPITAEPAWDSAETRALAVRACFDCHSNETRWPWYTNVAPVSWVTTRHVDEGRSKLNYSEFDRRQEEASESAETVREGEMPLFDYTVAHPEARLSDTEIDALVAGLLATFGGDR